MEITGKREPVCFAKAAELGCATVPGRAMPDHQMHWPSSSSPRIVLQCHRT